MPKSYVRGLVVTLVLALGGLGAPQAWSQGALPTPTVSQSLAKLFKAAKEAKDAKRWPEVIAKAEEILASNGRKPDDTYSAYYFLFDAHRSTNDLVAMRKDLDGIVDSGFLPPVHQALFLKPLVSMAFQAKEYDAAIAYGQRMVKSDTADSEVQTYIGQSYYQKGAFAESARIFNDLVNDQIKSGQMPREQYLQLLQSSYSKLGNKNSETDALEKLVVYYPKPIYWDALLYSVRSNPALDPRQKLWVYRLMWATGTLKQGTDFNMFAEYAGGGMPAEAQKVYEAGLKANAFSEDQKANAERRMASAARIAAADREELPKLEAEAKAAATGDLDVSLGMALYSYGEPARAIEALQRGLAKGGLKEQLAFDGAMMLGMAQERVKDNAGAEKTFQGIKTDNPNMQRIIKLWILYVK